MAGYGSHSAIHHKTYRHFLSGMTRPSTKFIAAHITFKPAVPGQRQHQYSPVELLWYGDGQYPQVRCFGNTSMQEPLLSQ